MFFLCLLHNKSIAVLSRKCISISLMMLLVDWSFSSTGEEMCCKMSPDRCWVRDTSQPKFMLIALIFTSMTFRSPVRVKRCRAVDALKERDQSMGQTYRKWLCIGASCFWQQLLRGTITMRSFWSVSHHLRETCRLLNIIRNKKTLKLKRV